MLDAQVSLVPKEVVTDVGWRKALVLIVTLVCAAALCMAVIFIRQADQAALIFCAPVMGLLIVYIRWWMKTNLANYDASATNGETKQILEMITALNDKGILKAATTPATDGGKS